MAGIETGAHFPGRRAVVGANQQFSGVHQALEQQVYRSQHDGQGLARPRAGDAQQGPIPVADEVHLLVIEFRGRLHRAGAMVSNYFMTISSNEGSNNYRVWLSGLRHDAKRAAVRTAAR